MMLDKIPRSPFVNIRKLLEIMIIYINTALSTLQLPQVIKCTIILMPVRKGNTTNQHMNANHKVN